MTNYCTTLLMDCTPDGKPSKNEHFFLLSDCLSEDKTLRYEIHRAKLVYVPTEKKRCIVRNIAAIFFLICNINGINIILRKGH